MRKTFLAIFIIAGIAAMIGKLSNKESFADSLFLENVEGSLFPYPHAPWNECVMSTSSQRDPCSSPSYC